MKIALIGAGLTSASCIGYFKLYHKDKFKNIQFDVFETRSYLGGNCADSVSNGVLHHLHGPHAFHCDDKKTWDFVNEFSDFDRFKLRVKARLGSNKIIPIPFNLLSEELIGSRDKNFIKKEIFETYSCKMWGVESLEELPLSITNRVPKFRDSYEDSYHLNKYQGNPKYGFSKMFEEIFHGKNINIRLNSHRNKWKEVINSNEYDLIIYSGKIDEFYDFKFGELEYRSLDIKFKWEKSTKFNQLNECNYNVEHTRKIDHSFWREGNINVKTGETIVSYEYPKEYVREFDTPYYPITWRGNTERYLKYFELTKKEKNVMFMGRLGKFSYMDMNIAVQSVINKMESVFGK